MLEGSWMNTLCSIPPLVEPQNKSTLGTKTVTKCSYRIHTGWVNSLLIGWACFLACMLWRRWEAYISCLNMDRAAPERSWWAPAVFVRSGTEAFCFR